MILQLVLVAALSVLADAQCTKPFTNVGGYCVYVDPLNSGTWSAMRARCQELGGDFMNLYTAQNYADIVYYIQAQGWPSNYDYWTGGSDEGHEGIWAWTDGTLMRMGTPMWANGGCDNIQRPDGGLSENCAVISGLFHLFVNDVDCNSPNKHPICVSGMA